MGAAGHPGDVYGNRTRVTTVKGWCLITRPTHLMGWSRTNTTPPLGERKKGMATCGNMTTVAGQVGFEPTHDFRRLVVFKTTLLSHLSITP